MLRSIKIPRGGEVVNFLGVWMIVLAANASPQLDIPEWIAPAAERGRANPLPTSAEALRKGKGLYLRHCAVCHGNQGRGDGPAARPHTRRAKAPKDLSQPELQSRFTDGEIFWKISTGFRAAGRIIMPSFGEDIRSEADRWSVVHFVRSLRRAEASQ